MHLLLGSLINTIPKSSITDEFATATLPPLTMTPSGADIDYSLLLFAEQLVVDEESLQYLLNHPHSILQTIGKSLETLRRNGLVRTANFRSITQKHSDNLERAAKLAADNPQYWLDGVKRHITKYGDVRPSLAKIFDGQLSPWDEQIFPVANFYARKNRSVSRLGAKRLTNMILQTPLDEMSSTELRDAQTVIAETVRIVGGQALIAEVEKSRHYSWNTCDHIFDMLAEFRPSAQEPLGPHLRGCRDFFRVAYQDFAPKSQTRWLEILLHKDVHALRKKISEATTAGAKIDAEFANREYAKLIAKLGETQKTKTLVGRGVDVANLTLGAAAGVATGGWTTLASLLVGVGVSAAGSVGKEAFDRYADHKGNNDFRWMYFTSPEYQGNE